MDVSISNVFALIVVPVIVEATAIVLVETVDPIAVEKDRNSLVIAPDWVLNTLIVRPVAVENRICCTLI